MEAVRFSMLLVSATYRNWAQFFSLCMCSLCCYKVCLSLFSVGSWQYLSYAFNSRNVVVEI